MKNNAYNKLVKYQKDFPELTFQNEGYQYLKKDVVERHKEQIKEISDILREEIIGFSEFNNFKLDKNGEGFDIRCQYYWSETYIGVGYFHINYFKEE